MKYTKFYLILIFIISVLITSCTEIQEDIVPPESVSVHGIGVLVKSSPNFHGNQLVNNNMNDCKRCHSSDFSGGTAKVSCGSTTCHPGIFVHTDQIMNPNSEQFHGNFIEADNWDLGQCAACHGDSYEGGIVSPTCNECHINEGGPEACNTCHGDFANPSRTSPPRALNNSILTTDPGVGAHIVHLTDVKIAENVQCIECHIPPSYFGSNGHIDSTPKAEVIFGSFSSSGIGEPLYNPTNYKCNNTYCHGSFAFSKETSLYQFAYTGDIIEGNNYNPVWNKVDGSESTCGTCHGLPPTGHMSSELRSCSTCHIGIVNNKGEIIDKSKHMDGNINVFGN